MAIRYLGAPPSAPTAPPPPPPVVAGFMSPEERARRVAAESAAQSSALAAPPKQSPLAPGAVQSRVRQDAADLTAAEADMSRSKAAGKLMKRQAGIGQLTTRRLEGS